MARGSAMRPNNAEAGPHLGRRLVNRCSLADAVDQFTAIVALRGDNVQALSALAWIRATSSDPSLQGGDEAVRLAERAAALTKNRDLPALDPLAAAYAATGRFPYAVRVARTRL